MQQKTSNLIARAKILVNIREWFNKKDFFEVETPILVNCPDISPNLNILETKIHSSSIVHSSPLERGKGCVEPIKECVKYLITSPEFSMKKLLASNDIDKIFTITKVFRDGEEDTGIHAIEFTMLEWYRKNADYNGIMKDTEELIKFLSSQLLVKQKDDKGCFFTPFSKGGRLPRICGAGRGDFSTAQPTQFNPTIGREQTTTKRASANKSIFPVPASEKSPLAPLCERGRTPFPRLKISTLFKKYSEIDKVEELKLPVFTKIVHSRGYSKDKNLTYEQCFNLIFLNEIDPTLPKTPFFLIDYPAPLACLAKLKKNNPFIAERFELYINGIELCNGFSELTDGKEQLARFKKENIERKNLGKPELPIDYELCEKLNLIGRASGNALGIDRLVMILLGVKTIYEILT